MRKKKNIILACTLLMFSCGGLRHGRTSVPLPEASLPEKEQTWQLVEMGGKELSRSHALCTLRFNTETGMIDGHAACNRYSAPFTLVPLKGKNTGEYEFKAGKVLADSVRCPEADMNSEARYFSLLEKADEAHIDRYTLLLLRKGQPTLKFELQ